MATRPDDRRPQATPYPAQPIPGEQAGPESLSADDAEQYEHLMDDFGVDAGLAAPGGEGEVLEGRVLAVTPTDVIVDIGSKSEGIVPIHEFRSPEGAVTVAGGDSIEVMIDRHAPNAEGFIGLSHLRAVKVRAWDNLERAHQDNLTVAGHVVSRTKGGLLVNVGIDAFLPTSHVDARPVHNLDSLIGQDIPVRVVKINRRRGNIVVSRKLAVEEEATSRREAILGSIAEGAVLSGVVKNLTDYGAFIDLGGIDGLLHVSDMSYGRVTHPSEVVHSGDTIDVKVLKYERDKQRISLGMKQIAPDPWESAVDRFVVGSKVIGHVVSVTDYGAFVELEPGVEGLIHITEMTWSRRMKHPTKVVRVGDHVEAVVLEVKVEDRRISLGIKQLEVDPWTTAGERYSVGSVVEGRVRKLTDFGAFIEIEEGIDGLVHVSDLSWTKRVKHPSELLRKGQQVQSVILALDAGQRRLSLGIKQLQPDAWESFFTSHMVNDVVRGKAVRAATFGVFVELAPGVEGLCHKSEIPGGNERGTDTPPLPIGEEFDFKIVKMNEGEKRIGLSLAAAADEDNRTRLMQYHRQATAATQTLEEALQRGRRTLEETDS